MFCLIHTVSHVWDIQPSKQGRNDMGKGNNSQRNDKKNKKVKQGDKKSAAKPANKK